MGAVNPLEMFLWQILQRLEFQALDDHEDDAPTTKGSIKENEATS